MVPAARSPCGSLEGSASTIGQAFENVSLDLPKGGRYRLPHVMSQGLPKSWIVVLNLVGDVARDKLHCFGLLSQVVGFCFQMLHNSVGLELELLNSRRRRSEARYRGLYFLNNIPRVRGRCL